MKEIETITSKDNQKLKHARQVRDGNAENKIFIEGRRLADEALRSDLTFDLCFLSTGFSPEPGLKERLDSRNIEVVFVAENIFNSIADTKNPQGIILIAEKPASGENAIEQSLKDGSPVVLLHEANNPSNIGSIMRTAEAGGVAGIILTNGSADAFSARSIRASMGAAFRLPIWQETGFDQALDWAKQKGLIATAADIKAEQNYTDIDWNKPRLLVFGSEAHGLSSEESKQMQEHITIRMKKETESLNLSVSAGIIIFESLRQRN